MRKLAILFNVVFLLLLPTEIQAIISNGNISLEPQSEDAVIFTVLDSCSYKVKNIDSIQSVIQYAGSKLEENYTIQCTGIKVNTFLDYVKTKGYNCNMINSVSLSYKYVLGEVISVTYNMTYNTEFKVLVAYKNPALIYKLNSTEIECLNKSKRILDDIIEFGMTDIQKERAVHDYIIKNTTYGSDTTLDSHNIDALLFENKGVCDAYAKQFMLLMNMLGFRCRRETGIALDNKGVSVGRHAWNVIELYGKEVYVDVTWDDTDSDAIKYQYFNIPYEAFKENHVADTGRDYNSQYIY